MFSRWFYLALFCVSSYLGALSGSPESCIVRSIAIEVVDESAGSANTLLSTLKTKEHERFSHVEFDKDLKLIAKEFDQVEPIILVVDGEVEIVLKVWKKPIIKTIVWKGNRALTDEKLKQQVGVGADSVYDREGFSKGIQKLRQYYVKKGFFEIEIDHNVIETGTPHLVNIEVSITEGRAGYVEKIIFKGFSEEEEQELSSQLFTKEYSFWLSWLTNRGTFFKDLFQQDEMLVHSFLQNKGYLDAQVTTSIEPSSKREDRIVITISATKGEKYYFGDLSVDGSHLFDAKTLLPKMGIQKGDLYSPDMLRQAIRSVVGLYGAKGYIEASVIPETRLKGKVYDVVFHVEENKCYRVGLIEIVGNTRTDARVILHEMLLTPGDVFDTRLLEKSEERLRNIGYFKSVNVYAVKSSRLTAGATPFRDIHVEVEEVPTTSQFTAFVGWNSMESVSGGFGISESNFKASGIPFLFPKGRRAIQGGGEYLGINAVFGTKQLLYTLGWSKPYVFDSKWTVGLDLDKHRNSFAADEYTINSYTARVFAKRPLNPFLNVNTHYRLRNSDIDLKGIKDKSKNRQLITESKRAGTISALGLGLDYDSTNHPVMPKEGTRSTLSAEFAGLGGSYQFLTFKYLNSFFYSLNGKGIWKLRADFQAIKTMLGTRPEHLPLDERLYAGGELSVRGFRHNGIGPKFSDDRDTPRGGMSALILSAEYERPIWQKFHGFVFLDAGNTWWSQFSVGQIRYSPGLGIRFYLTESSPLSLGVGFPLNAGKKDDVQRFFFSLGVGF